MSIQFDYIEEEFSRVGTQFLKRKKKKSKAGIKTCS